MNPIFCSSATNRWFMNLLGFWCNWPVAQLNFHSTLVKELSRLNASKAWRRIAHWIMHGITCKYNSEFIILTWSDSALTQHWFVQINCKCELLSNWTHVTRARDRCVKTLHMSAVTFSIQSQFDRHHFEVDQSSRSINQSIGWSIWLIAPQKQPFAQGKMMAGKIGVNCKVRKKAKAISTLILGVNVALW